MDGLDATHMLLTVLSDTNKNAIRGSLLQKYLDFFMTLLEGGNQRVQNSIHTYCLNRPESEMLFMKFNDII